MMKQLSLSKPLLLITVGLPGAGKSVFAGQFAQSFGFAWVHANHVRHILTTSPSFNAEENRAVEHICLLQLNELLRTKANIMYDGEASTAPKRAELATKARAAGYRVLLVWVQTDPATAKFRAAKRGTRVPTDTFAANLSEGVFAQLSRKFEKPQEKEAYVVISGKHPFGPQAKALMTKIEAIDRPLKEKAKSTVKNLVKPGGKPMTRSMNRLANRGEIKELPRISRNGKKIVPNLENLHQAPASTRAQIRFDDSRPLKTRP